MKKLLILVVLVSSAVFAVSPDLAQDVTAGSSSSVSAFSPMNPDVLWEVPYDPDNFNDAYALYEASGWTTVDDFVPGPCGWDSWGAITGLTLYVLTFNGEGYDPLDVLIYSDSGGSGPDNLLETIPATRTFTDMGDTFYGYTVYAAECILSICFDVFEGTRYWITVNPPGGFWYWLNSEGTGLGEDAYRSEDGGYSWTPADVSCDMMMIVEAYKISVDETTWGQIKAAF